MKLMRHKRSGRVAVYDDALIASGNWEPHEEKKPRKGPSTEDELLKAADRVGIEITRADGTTESIEC